MLARTRERYQRLAGTKLRSRGCQQHFRRFPVQSHRTVLDAMRYDDELARLHNLLAVAKPHEQAPAMNKEQFIVVLPK